MTAIYCRRSYQILTADFGTNLADMLARLVPTERGLEVARGNVETGDGLGYRLILDYFEKVNRQSIKRANIERALSALKDSGEWDRIRIAVLTETNEVREAAERQALSVGSAIRHVDLGKARRPERDCPIFFRVISLEKRLYRRLVWPNGLV